MSDFTCAVEEAAAGERAIVRLGGDLHVSNAFAIHQKLVSLAEKYSALDIVLGDVTAFDVSAMQLLLAAKKETDTQVKVSFGEGCDSVTHWLKVAGMTSAFAA